jgi:hypothetical protein
MTDLDAYTINASGYDGKFIRELCKKLSDSSNTLSSNKRKTNRVKQMLYTSGWKPGWIKEKLANLNDEMLTGKSITYSANCIAILWLAEYNGATEYQPPNLFRDLTHIGLIRRNAGLLTHMYSPLINHCYTDTQLLLQCMEHTILGDI